LARMSSRMWRTVSDGIKSLRLTASLQSRFLNAQAANASVPQKPKRPLTPYFRFMMKVRDDIIKQNPSLAQKDIIKLIGQKWTKLDDASKDHYSAGYKEEMIPYSEELAKYNDTLTPEIVEKENQLKLEKQLKRDRRVQRKKLLDLGKPKKPTTPFLQFVKLNFKSKPGGGVGHAQEEIQTLAKRWQGLKEAEKDPFIDKYRKEAESYKTALLKWESTMLKQGNVDVVRQDHKPKPKHKS